MKLTNKLDALPTIASADALGKAWLVRVRWFAAAGHVALALLSSLWLELDVSPAFVACVITLTVLSNLALSRMREGQRIIAATLAADVVLLTALVQASGGAANPFSVLYVIHVAVAARLASTRVTATIWTLSTLGYGSLFLLSEHGRHGSHYVGMWVAYSLAAALTGYFVARVSSVLSDREAQLRTLQRTTQAAQRLASMSTMAASAAHELGTPLGTIALLAEGIEKGRGRASDASVIAQQVERCRSIVRDLSAARAVESDAISLQSLEAVLTDAALDVPKTISVERHVDDAKVLLPKLALTRTLRDLMNNAAAAGTHKIVISAHVTNDRCKISIEDDGPGMPPAVLERLGEPYFTTKPGGLGLGVYLATVFTEAIGGTIDVDSHLGKGTRVTLDLPVSLR